MDNFIGNIYQQNCGDSLLVLEKSELKKGKDSLFRCQFQKYPFEVLKTKGEILRGTCINPEIENHEFIGQIFLQNCGDSLKVLEKITEGENKGKYKCEFIKYPYTIIADKINIKRGNLLNPCIEEKEFVGKEFLQNCGDTLFVIEKTKEKLYSNYLFKCKFQKYSYITLATKNNIVKGRVNNPQIEKVEFIDKIWEQNCGDSLKILEKTDKKDYRGEYYFKGIFLKYPCEVLFFKSNAQKGKVENPNLPWNNKENLINYIQNNFKEKPTLIELANSLNISRQRLGQSIITFELKNYIKYYPNYKEGEIEEFIKNFYKKEILINSSKELKSREIDIYIPSLKLGIEYNGSYWHSSLFKSQNYHQEKSILAREKGIELLNIFEYEWLNKKEILQSLIKSKLGVFEKKIGARECQVRELENKSYQNFCNENHLQGEAGAKVKLGLYYENNLIQIMSFGVPRFTDKYQWEIIRECSKLGYFILGGKERLWSYFVKKYNPENCISYCDFSKFSGDSYLKLGFLYKQLNKPGFVWYDENTKEVFWRNPQNHQEMKKRYLQIWDCGQLVFIWNKQNGE